MLKRWLSLGYIKNGGKVYDLVMDQKHNEAKEKKHKIQDRMVKDLRRKASSKYANAWNSDLVVTTKGKKTGLYNELRGLSSIRGL